ncbi:hypothetical protein Ade02nite_55750 [Paractinoplanes deccanensis]|uniref:TfoX N-terminal domain-containing protein n=1 Tax=Paractinoplanes deccanensis TaxID=113561 RepID=A0ABQ3YAA4_9ACTN|nr:TfoX/Sxy family protein [Actinoplanes deccanensis]GID76934.1 hypothetical protein Ade02nite_55750 [Actinoplanes deccanensis]
MAYDPDLADRIRESLRDEAGLTERRMFGGLAFLIDGNMAACASSQGGLMLRVDPAETPALLARPEARRFEMRGRELNGWLHIDASALTSENALESWLDRGIRYARSLPAK